MKQSMSLNDLYKKNLIENCRKIEINILVRKASEQLKSYFLKSLIVAENEEITLATSQTGNGGLRFWLKCPYCRKKYGILYEHPLNKKIACRRCHRLKYLSNKQQRAIKTLT